MLRKCAEKLGQSVPEFVRTVVITELGKLDALDPFAIPCPFCLETDSLELLETSIELLDGTEYDGPSMRCERCVTITAMTAWIKRGLRNATSSPAGMKGGAA